MHDLIQSYHVGERSTAVQGLIAGVLLLIATLALWKVGSGAMARGAATVFLAFGLLQAAASGGYLAVLSNRTPPAASPLVQEAELRSREIARMNDVLRGAAYIGTLTFLSALLLIGLTMVLLIREHPMAVGVGLGLMFVGVLGHSFEAVSLNKNREYLRAVVANAAAR